MISEKLFELAEQAIEKTYPNFYNKPKGYWGDSLIPNYGILKMNIVKVLKSAISESNKWIPIEDCPKDKTIVQLYGKIEIPNYNSESDYDEQNNVHFGYYENSEWWSIYDRNNCRSLRIKDVTHFRYLNQDKPN